MHEVEVVCMVSYFDLVSESPYHQSEEEKHVVALDGYYKQDLESLSDDIALLRLEFFGGKEAFFSSPIKRGNIISLVLVPCCKEEANAGIYSFFNYSSESYSYYCVQKVVWDDVSAKANMLKRFCFILDKAKYAFRLNRYRYKIRQAQYIRSKAICQTVEPVGQGNLTLLYNDSDFAKVCIDVGHGTPVNRLAIEKKGYVFDDNFKHVEAVFITHWDEDHYKLATHQRFSFLLEIKWYFPFSHNILMNGGYKSSLEYEHRLSVWETLGKVMENNKFYVIDHNTSGAVSIHPNKKIFYYCGDARENYNNRGVLYNIKNIMGSKKEDILLCGDMDYKLFPDQLVKEYTSVVVSHHGSSCLSLDKHPCPFDNNSIAVFSFGYNSKYKHPDKKSILRAYKLGFTIACTSCPIWVMYNLRTLEKLKHYNCYASSINLI